MSDAWHYRSEGEEFGPVRFADLQGLLAIGRLQPDYEVRRDDDSSWIKLQAAIDLVNRQQTSSVSLDESEFSVGDLEAMLASEDTQSASVNVGALDADAADLEFMLTQEQASPAPPPAAGDLDADLDAMLAGDSADERPASPAARGAQQKRWYYRVLNQELGPIDLDELMELAAEGSIGPDDEIRLEDSREWDRADSIVGLFTAKPSAAPKTDETEDWFCQRQGEKSGPFTFDALMELAAGGQLAPTDQIRQGGLGAWFDAASMVGLFTHEQLVAAGLAEGAAEPAEPADDIPEPQTEDAAPEPVRPARPRTPQEVRQRKSKDPRRSRGSKSRARRTQRDDEIEDWAASVLSEPDPDEQPRSRQRSTSRSSDASEEATPAAEPAATVATPAARAPAPALAPVMSASAPPPPPPSTFKATKKRSAPSLSLSMPAGLGSAISAILNPKILGGIAAVVVLGGLWMLIGGSLKGQAEFAETKEIWNQLKPLIDSKADDAQWNSVKSLEGQAASLVERATAAGAGPNQPLLQVVLRVNRDLFPEVLKSKSETSKSRIKAIENYLKQGDTLAGG